MRFRLRSALAGIAVSLIASLPAAHAADLVIGASAEPQAIDPLFSRSGNNQAIAQHIFDRLVTLDDNLQVHPGLAASWTNPDPLTWVLRLRAGVTFHDGSPFAADDVVYSTQRIATIANSPVPFTQNISFIDKIEAVDPLTLRVTTKTPVPLFMDLFGTIYIVSKKAAEGHPSSDFNAGIAAVGTGPYKFVSWVPGDKVVMARNDAFWGEKAAFENVTFKVISNAAARVAALRSGAVDLIDNVPASQLGSLRGVAGISIHASESTRFVYLALDTARDQSPLVTSVDGKPLATNPLKDLRVRQAMSKMINRKQIIDRVLDGAGAPAGQFVPQGVVGYSDALPVDTYDPAAAKALLAQAGVSDGFGITINAANDLPGDSEMAQALGQFFTRGGLKVNGVVTEPFPVYVGNAGKQAFSAFIFNFTTTTPSAIPGLTNVLMTFDKDAGTGSFNRARYSNPAYDAAVRAASAEFDPDKRAKLVAAASEVAFKDMAVVPLYFSQNIWASKATIGYRPNKEGVTKAMAASVVK